MTRTHVHRLSFIALLATASCTSSADHSVRVCEDGELVYRDGKTACFYEDALIVADFECPDFIPVGLDFEDGILCTEAVDIDAVIGQNVYDPSYQTFCGLPRCATPFDTKPTPFTAGVCEMTLSRTSPTGQTETLGALSYEVNDRGDVIRFGEDTFDYDERGLMVGAVQDGKTYTLERDREGRLTTVLIDDELTFLYDYDANRRLLRERLVRDGFTSTTYEREYSATGLEYTTYSFDEDVRVAYSSEAWTRGGLLESRRYHAASILNGWELEFVQASASPSWLRAVNRHAPDGKENQASLTYDEEWRVTEVSSQSIVNGRITGTTADFADLEVSRDASGDPTSAILFFADRTEINVTATFTGSACERTPDAWIELAESMRDHYREYEIDVDEL